MIKSSIPLALLLVLGLGTTAYAAVPAISTADAIKAVEQQSNGRVISADLRDEAGLSVYHVSAQLQDGTTVEFLVDGRTGRVHQAATTQAAVASDSIESGEGPNDADSGNEDAN